MSLIKVVLLDDEPRSLNVLKLLTSAYSDQVQVVAACTDPALAIEKINSLKPDLILMDIQMPKLNAFDVLAALDNPQVEVIFATAYNAYAIRAFEYSAVDYLLKPIDEDQFRRAITKAIQRVREKNANENFETLMYNIQKIRSSDDMKICIPDSKGFKVIRVADILYFVADICYSVFHIKNHPTLISSKTLSEYEAMLDPNQFFRVHRSFIVNIQRIKEYRRGEGGTVVMENDKQLEVSRRKKEEFMARMRGLYSV